MSIKYPILGLLHSLVSKIGIPFFFFTLQPWSGHCQIVSPASISIQNTYFFISKFNLQALLAFSLFYFLDV